MLSLLRRFLIPLEASDPESIEVERGIPVKVGEAVNPVDCRLIERRGWDSCNSKVYKRESWTPSTNTLFTPSVIVTLRDMKALTNLPMGMISSLIFVSYI